MKAREDIIKLADKLGAEIEIWPDSENSYVIEAIAPDDMEWIESGSVSLVARCFTYAKKTKNEAMNDIYDRMKLGLIKY